MGKQMNGNVCRPNVGDATLPAQVERGAQHCPQVEFVGAGFSPPVRPPGRKRNRIRYPVLDCVFALRAKGYNKLGVHSQQGLIDVVARFDETL